MATSMMNIIVTHNYPLCGATWSIRYPWLVTLLFNNVILEYPQINSITYLTILGVRSLANESRARQFNPLNPMGWGGYRFLKQIWQSLLVVRGRACVVVRAWSVVRGRSCVVVRGRARSCVVVSGRVWSCVVVRGRSCTVVRGLARSCVAVRGRPCVVGRARSCVRGRSWSCAVVRGRAQSCAVVRGRARSCVVVPFCPLRGQHGSQQCRDTNERTNERTTSNHPLNPPGVGWVNFFNFFKVRVSIRTCVPNFGSFRRPCRKFWCSFVFKVTLSYFFYTFPYFHPFTILYIWICSYWHMRATSR